MSRAAWLRTVVGIVLGAILGGLLAAWLPVDWLSGRSDVRPTSAPLQPVFDGPDVVRDRVPATLVPMVRDLGQPTDLAFVPGHPSRLVVASKWGSLHLVDVERGRRTFWAWLEVDDQLECGVLGIAFHPRFEDDGRLFDNHVPMRGPLRTVVTEYRTDPRTLHEPRPVAEVLSVQQPAGTHNGGQIGFGPDGMLYVALGDGSAGGDPHHNGQDAKNRLGAVLRLDVTAPGPARAPPDNPFVDRDDVHPQIYALGLRNPWRFTFAPDGRLIVADVGQSRWEEIDVVRGGDNLGWSIREGPSCHAPAEGCAEAGLVDPVYSYGRREGASITGGVVWQGPGRLAGHYVFGDFITGRLWAMRLPPGERPRVDDVLALGRFDVSPTAFTVAPDGSAWLADFRSEIVYRVVVDEP